MAFRPKVYELEIVLGRNGTEIYKTIEKQKKSKAETLHSFFVIYLEEHY